MLLAVFVISKVCAGFHSIQRITDCSEKLISKIRLYDVCLEFEPGNSSLRVKYVDSLRKDSAELSVAAGSPPEGHENKQTENVILTATHQVRPGFFRKPVHHKVGWPLGLHRHRNQGYCLHKKLLSRWGEEEENRHSYPTHWKKKNAMAVISYLKQTK